MSPAIVAWSLTWVTLAFVVFCADSVGEEERPAAERAARAALWVVTLTGWLLSLEYDRAAAHFFLLAEVTMAFVVWCVDALSADLQNKPLRRVLRSVFWVGPVARYLSDKDSVALIAASVTIWGLLTTGWLLGLMHDRVALPIAAL